MSAFMVPQVTWLTSDEAQEYCCDAEEQSPDSCWDGDCAHPAGFYGRLSAPGYLDASEWQGPFDRAWKALRAVCETYEVGTDGEPRWEVIIDESNCKAEVRRQG